MASISARPDAGPSRIDTATVQQVDDGTHLDAPDARARDPHGDLSRLVQVASLDKHEPTKLLVGFGEWTVRRREPAVADPHGRGRRDVVQRLRQDELTARLQLLVVGEDLVDEGVDLVLRHGIQRGLIPVHQAEVPHRGLLGTEWILSGR